MINEEAIKHSYELFQGTGYTDSYDTFKALLNSDPAAIEHAYKLFGETGYTDDMDTFKGMLGVGTDTVADPIKKKRGRYGIVFGGWFIGLARISG